VINKIEKKLGLDFSSIFCKNVSTRFFSKPFCSVFEVRSLRNTRKCDTTKKVEGNCHRHFRRLFGKKFSTWTFCKNILYSYGVFELPLPLTEKRPKTYLKKKPRKKVGWWVSGSGDLPNVRKGPSFLFLAAPRTNKPLPSLSPDQALLVPRAAYGDVTTAR
jgi:hypothetical protein